MNKDWPNELDVYVARLTSIWLSIHVSSQALDVPVGEDVERQRHKRSTTEIKISGQNGRWIDVIDALCILTLLAWFDALSVSTSVRSVVK